MAGFHTHVTVSSLLGVGYAAWGSYHWGFSPSACALAGGMCAIGGMLPDLDSDSGIPARETITFFAAVTPMILFNRLAQHGFSVEQMSLTGMPAYLFIRFGLGSLLKQITVHRGMFHSIPAMVIAGLIGFLICDTGLSVLRAFKGAGVALGFLSHLILDEIWSVNLRNEGPVFKKSLGTAMKFIGKDSAANSLTYGLLMILGLIVYKDCNDPLFPLAQTSFVHPPDQRTFGSALTNPQVQPTNTDRRNGPATRPALTPPASGTPATPTGNPSAPDAAPLRLSPLDDSTTNNSGRPGRRNRVIHNVAKPAPRAGAY